MPTVPGVAMPNANPLSPPPSPETQLIAAADMHQSGEFQSAPVPEGKSLQTGHGPGRRHKLRVMK